MLRNLPGFAAEAKDIKPNGDASGRGAGPCQQASDSQVVDDEWGHRRFEFSEEREKVIIGRSERQTQANAVIVAADFDRKALGGPDRDASGGCELLDAA